MDIDDILAEVDGDAVPLDTRDLQELSRAWVTERSAPEILPWPAGLMNRVLKRIGQQVGLPVTASLYSRDELTQRVCERLNW